MNLKPFFQPANYTDRLPDFSKEPILALSWKAPYAQLMLRGKVETRTWPAKYRGWVLICCSKQAYSANKLIEIAGKRQFNRILSINPSCLNYKPELGMAIAIARLVDCRPMTMQDENDCFVEYKEPWIENKKLVSGKSKEKKKQLWCHIYENVMPINPFPFKGNLKWKELSGDDIKNINLSQIDHILIEKIMNDYALFLKEYNFTETQVQEIVRRQEDCIEMPEPFSDFFTLGPSMISGTGFFSKKQFSESDIICPARLNLKRTPAGRFINHSPIPNAEFRKSLPELSKPFSDLYVVAKRDIIPGEEILIDYRQAGQVNGNVPTQ